MCQLERKYKETKNGFISNTNSYMNDILYRDGEMGWSHPVKLDQFLTRQKRGESNLSQFEFDHSKFSPQIYFS